MAGWVKEIFPCTWNTAAALHAYLVFENGQILDDAAHRSYLVPSRRHPSHHSEATLPVPDLDGPMPAGPRRAIAVHLPANEPPGSQGDHATVDTTRLDLESELVRSSGRPVSQMAGELGVNHERCGSG
ncbi:hypothetical protein GCM10010377_68080 [Streptomyces viridiviolaceus]|nr:hypothetical protein GCM10010377_68080 [Streptomyces viridiviolaceus]